MPGVILGIPGYAVLKVIVEHVFAWYKDVSGLYEGDYNPAYEPGLTDKKQKKKVNKKRN